MAGVFHRIGVLAQFMDTYFPEKRYKESDLVT